MDRLGGGDATRTVAGQRLPEISYLRINPLLLSFKSIDGVATPSPDSNKFTLAAGASKTVTLTLPTGLSSGQYHGFVLISGTQGQTTLRIPYWYGIVGKTAQNINVITAPSADPSACSDVVDFRLLDAVGLPVKPAAAPSVTTSDTKASVATVTPLGNIPGTYEADIVTGQPDSNGVNTFTISADNSSWQLFVQIDNSGFTSCSGMFAVSASKSRPHALAGKNRRSSGRKIDQ